MVQTELRNDAVLGSLLSASNAQITAKIVHLSDTLVPLTGVCCTSYVGRGARVKGWTATCPPSRPGLATCSPIAGCE
jgi:hypothetical protein